MPDFDNLPLRDAQGTVRAVIETPRGSGVKLRFDAELGCFEFSRPLILGVTYPYDWGFFPSTLASDGDPLDVLVIHDAATAPGVVIPCRPVGVVRLSQKREHGGGRERNHRVIAVPFHAPRFDAGHDLPPRVREELQQFFTTVVALEGKEERIEGWGNVKEAESLIRTSERAWRERHRS